MSGVTIVSPAGPSSLAHPLDVAALLVGIEALLEVVVKTVLVVAEAPRDRSDDSAMGEQLESLPQEPTAPLGIDIDIDRSRHAGTAQFCNSQNRSIEARRVWGFRFRELDAQRLLPRSRM